MVREGLAALVAAQGAGGGWSYGRGVPPDTDSTAWALQALRGARTLPHDARAAALQFLDRQRAGDLYSTYSETSAIREFVEAQGRSVAGWTSPHVDVAAAVALALDAPVQLLRALLARQRGAGYVESYWWRSPFYATALVYRALAAARARADEDRSRTLFRALLRDQLDDGGYPLGGGESADAFSTALALECLCYVRHLGAQEAAAGAAGALAAGQLAGGGWLGDYVMRIPAPDVLDPRHVGTWSRGTGGGNSFVFDDDGLFATAAAIWSLALWLSCERGEALGGAEEWPVLEPGTSDAGVATIVVG